MKWIYSNCIWSVFFFCFHLRTSSELCISSTVQYGESTPDYDVAVGSDLIVNCTLKDGSLPEIKIPVNSSQLAFKKDGNSEWYTGYTSILDNRTAQLRIPNAQVEDSGTYHCLILPSNAERKLVCSTGITVGYPPKNVTNFKCINRNFDNLTCTWDVEPNLIRTNYTLQKTLLSKNFLNDCPQPNNKTFCQWRDNTDPPYQTMQRIIYFVLRGNNSLGSIVNEFQLDHYQIVIPNQPEDFKTVDIGKNSISLHWERPTMNQVPPPKLKLELYYQLWFQELGPESKDKIVVVEVGADIFNYTFDDLIPHYQYNLSLRCRSNYTDKDDMWSPIVSIVRSTLPDVPYSTPEVNPEGFVIHNFGGYRNTTLYWKPVPKKFHNGEDFYYHIAYSQIKGQNTSTFISTSKTPSVRIGHLNNDAAYTFHIHVANKEGISENFRTIIIDSRDKILHSVKDIRAISNGVGFYNLSWSNAGLPHTFNYTVFWCLSRKPSHCDGPIQWTEEVLEDSKFSLNVSNVNSNFQFAVAAVQNNRHSGMQWASCIVPQKAPLGQIPIDRIEPNSYSLQVSWKLNCEAQKSVIDRYVITYCRQGENCSDAVANSDVLSYTLRKLHPFSNYSIKLRAFNKENKPSEDTDEMYQSTLSASPSDPPRNVAIVSKSNSSFSVSWTPPLEPNGIITHYFIYHNESKDRMVDGSCKTCVFHVKDLKEFTVYNVSIQACVGDYCSIGSAPVTVLTEVGEPGIMYRPFVETVNATHVNVSWVAPFLPNGPINFYEVLWQQENDNETKYKSKQGLSTLVELTCPNLLEGGMTYQFYVRAVNVKNGETLYGPFSEPKKATACVISQGLAMIIGVAIGGTFVLAIFLLFLYKLVKWMSEKIHQVKNIAVRLPKELEGPETNPLNNYESFKNGLVRSIQNGKVEHLSYTIDESENKNRHGSGSSQFSNSSSDELIFKNGKCTKFGRKPSGDSSGCSSMTSNTTTRMQLSSDSGTESDFMVPASPDSVSNDLSLFNGHKPHMPILMEIHDSPETVSETQHKTGINTHLEKYNNFISGMVLKVDHPYSKFGISGKVTSSIPCQINPLAFYSCNLANSEPSVFEAQASSKQKSPVRPLYSKVGFAKSSGDILGISSRSKEIGYSKFGFATQDFFSVEADKFNPVVGMALVEDSVHREMPKSTSRDGCGRRPSPAPYSQDSEKGESDDCERRKPVCNRPSPGYVQVGDLRSMKEVDSISLSTCSLEEDNSPLQIPVDLACDLSDLSSVWTTGLFQLPPAEITGCLPFPISNAYQANGELTLTTSSSPSAGCLHVVSPSSVRAADNDPATHTHEDHFNLSNPQNVLPACDVAPCPSSTDPNGRGLESQRPSSFGKCTPLPEVLLAPGAGRNGYVPFSTLSSLCEPPVSFVPNTAESNVPLSIFPGGDINTDVDQNYITPSNRGELKLLQEGLLSNTKPFSPLLHCNGSKMRKISAPIKHILKPLPKMESEICEV